LRSGVDKRARDDPMRDNPVQFAFVREDPEIEASLVRRDHSGSALLIASGGCTALSLQALFPGQVSLQRLQSVTRRYMEIVQGGGG
jgi:hypothetical protein